LALEHRCCIESRFSGSRPRFARPRSDRGASTRVCAAPGQNPPARGCGLLGRVSRDEATVAIEAMMEGLANAELRGRTLPILPAGKKAGMRRALTTLIRASAPQTVDRQLLGPSVRLRRRMVRIAESDLAATPSVARDNRRC
jgi:hypothetical protein